MAEQSTSSNSEKSILNRRDVLAWAGAAATMGAAQAMATPAYSAFHVADLVMVDAITLADVIRSRQVSCVEVMTAYLDHIEKLNPKVNAIVALQDRAALLARANERDAQLARGELMGPLHGFPYAVKDLALVKGIRTTFGSPILKDFVPVTDSIMVERLRRAGAIFIGKTNTPEFGLGSHTYNPVYGVTRNAYTKRDQRAAAVAGPLFRSRCGCCPWPMVAITVAVSVIPPAGTTCLAFAPALGSCRPMPATFGCRLWAWSDQWRERSLTCRCCFPSKPDTTPVYRCRWKGMELDLKNH